MERTTYDRLECTAQHQVFPLIGDKMVGDITAEDEIILTADIIGGSPLTTALDVLTEKGLLGKTLAIGGMNLPLVLTAAFADADTPLEELEQELTGEAKDQIKRFDLGGDEDDDI